MMKFRIPVLVALCMTSMGGAVSLESSRPNIILVMTDDQGMGDLACFVTLNTLYTTRPNNHPHRESALCNNTD